MKRILTSVAVAVAGCAVAVAGAGVASAHDHGRDKDRGHEECWGGHEDEGYGDRGCGREYHHHHHHDFREFRRFDHSGAEAQGAAVGSPGVLSGNTIQVPVNIPINLCGDTIDVIGLLNPAFGNVCVNK
ncbi:MULTISPECIES: chaplin [Streptomycetaceae]|uniref:Chaplin domain-containing protein n=1 Tax=Streptantibioticus cattleyicolor (strain ATCC 35852 / DSM 46488 / JCM 4925 / NBRC 14057 / NRRL 8057) TaxID=1003195 RepID=F8JU37_STREN